MIQYNTTQYNIISSFNDQTAKMITSAVWTDDQKAVEFMRQPCKAQSRFTLHSI